VTWTGPDDARLAVLSPAPTFEPLQQVFQEIGTDPARILFGDGKLSELEDRGVSYIVLAGQACLDQFRPDLAIRQCHGRPMLLWPGLSHCAGPIVMPVFHPEAYRRNPRWQSLLRIQLGSIRRVALDRDNWINECPDTCVACRGEFYAVDPHGVVYCDTHAPRSIRRT
jgi:hypothetical protein